MTEPKIICEKPEKTMEPTGSEHQTKTDVTTSINVGTCPIATETSSPITQVVQQIPKKSRSDFIFGKSVGEGSFSTVFLATEKTSQHEYAVKVCDKRHILRERKQEYVRREREVLQIMTNVPGFVKLMCTFQDRQSLYFVMTYAPNGELLPHIKRVGCFSVECARHYTAELVLACEQMHRRNVVHRDLKPENILLDKRMHTLIADFGSAKVLTPADIAATQMNPSLAPHGTDKHDDNEDESSDDLCSEPNIDDVDAFYRPQKYTRKRKGSFVGTAQYVSPEVLQNAPISPAADLWALGCILYQMISGLPPFRGYNDFAIFKKILACNTEFPEFPEHFDPKAEDLVKQLLKLNPKERIGASDDYSERGYISIRMHPFLESINFETIREQKPPKINPYLPTCSNKVNEERTITTLETEIEKILCLSHEVPKSNKFDLSSTEKQRFLDEQKSDKWHPFADNEVILKKGFVNKHKGLFASKRMLILTTGPHLINVDPVEMIKTGEIPWGPELRVELGNSHVFFVHIAERTHFFLALEGTAQDWVSTIQRVHRLTYKELGESETI